MENKNITKSTTKNIIMAGKTYHNDNGEDYLIIYVNQFQDRTLLMNSKGFYIGAWGIDAVPGNWSQGHYFMNDFRAAVNWVLGK